MTYWVRLWCDMPTDPKWRVIAKKSGRPIAEVITVFTAMMANAGSNAAERGSLDHWSDEDIAAAFDMEPEHVAAIRSAMQGKTLDGERLKGWEKRQPKREDNSAERVKRWRERKATQGDADVTQRNAPDTDTDTDSETTASQPVATPREVEVVPVEVIACEPRPAPAAVRLDLRELSDRLFEAAGPALASQAIAPGLAAMTVPAMWIDQGCDLELDIIETLKAQATKRRGVMSWEYFTRAVAEAKAKRLAGLPKIDLSAAAPQQFHQTFHGSVKAMLAEMGVE